MKKTKKVCAELLAIGMALGSLTGCGAPKENVDGSDSPMEQEKPTEAEAPDEEPIVLKLTAVAGPDDGDWNDYWIIQYMEEKFQVDIQVEMITSEAEAKIPLLFASDDLPDFFVNGLTVEQIAQYGSEGYLIDVGSYLSEETTPNVWAILEKEPDFLAAMKNPDGTIYSLQGLDMGVHNQNVGRFYINYSWAEQLLGKTPETLDEFYEYLVGVKEKDMNGNGDPDDEIPLGGRYEDPEGIHAMLPVLNAVGFTRMGVEAIDGKVVYVPAEEKFRHVLEFMNRLYEEELLDPEFFTQTDEQRAAKDADYRYGAVGNYINSLNQPDPEISIQYAFLEPMTSQYNSTKMTGAQGVNLYGNIMITRECEHPEKLIEIYDWMLTREATVMILFGPEVGTWEGHEEYGVEYEFKDDVFSSVSYWPDSYADNNRWWRAEVMPSSGVFPIYRDYMAEDTSGGYFLPADTAEHLEDYYVVNWPKAIKYTAEEANELALLFTDITSYMDEMVTKMISGEVSVDEFDQYVQGLKDRGLDRYLEIQQSVYDRFVSSKENL